MLDPSEAVAHTHTCTCAHICIHKHIHIRTSVADTHTCTLTSPQLSAQYPPRCREAYLSGSNESYRSRTGLLHRTSVRASIPSAVKENGMKYFWLIRAVKSLNRTVMYDITVIYDIRRYQYAQNTHSTEDRVGDTGINIMHTPLG